MAKTSAATSTAASGGSKKKGQKEYSGRQKAAIFLVTIGSELSAEIFKYLREDEIETLTFEIARLETIDAERGQRRPEPGLYSPRPLTPRQS